MTALEAALAGLAALTAAGLLPVRALGASAEVAPFLWPLVGTALAGVAGLATALMPGDERSWFVGLGVVANAWAAWVLLRRRRRRRRRRGRALASDAERAAALAGGEGSRSGRAGSCLGALGAVAWCCRSLVRPEVGFDARSIWFLHARWLEAGHGVLLGALRNQALAFSHANYPLLAPGAVAVAWGIAGSASLRSAQLVVAALSAAAVGAAAVLVGSAVAERRPFWWALGAACGVGFALGAYGLAGAGATNGYVDLLWSAAAVGAVVAGLLGPIEPGRMAAARLLALAAGLTKNEGTATALVLVALIALRQCFDERARRSAKRRQARVSEPAGEGTRAALPWRTRAAVFVPNLLAAGVLVAWPIAAAALGATPDPDTVGVRHGSLAARAAATVHALAGDLRLAGAALGVGLVGTIALGRRRRALGLAADGWAWAVGAAEVVAVGLYYVLGRVQIDFWLDVSATRTMLFPNLLGLATLGIWLPLAAQAACIEPTWRGAGISVGARHADAGAGLDEQALARLHRRA
jgi:hypothetical protein